MALYVNTNVSSLNAQRKLANASLNLNTNYQRLSSGLRINSAKDDAAGLMIADRLTAQINGLNQGNRNANDGIALVQTVEGAMDETSNMLQRIRTLAVQAANGTNTDDDRKAIQDEITQLCEEIFRISQKTTFGGAQVLDGKVAPPPPAPANPPPAPINLLDSNGMIHFQVGANANDTLNIDLASSFKLSSMVDYTSPREAGGPPTQLLAKAIYEFDPTDEGNKGTTPAAFWAKLKDPAEGWAATAGFTGLVQTSAGGVARYTVTSQELAQITLSHIDTMIKYVDSKRSALGALQNRMESTIRNQSSISENSSDARARIRDTDFAAETAALTQNNIIQNASQSILAQANQRPAVALQLMG